MTVRLAHMEHKEHKERRKGSLIQPEQVEERKCEGGRLGSGSEEEPGWLGELVFEEGGCSFINKIISI